MRRRDFIAGLGSAAASSMVARGQQRENVRRIGILMYGNESDPDANERLAAFATALRSLGWSDQNNLQIDIRWASGEVDRMRMFARELVDLRPDVILATATPVTAALQRETKGTPIVFAAVADPVGESFVASLARPGANITGFVNVEASMGGKWVELLREIAPRIGRVTTIFNPETSAGHGDFFLPTIETAAQSFRLPLTATPVRSDAEIEAAIKSIDHEEGGLVVMGSAFMSAHRPRADSGRFHA
jgi:putative tryptophan/tyrosine transport system substrate-binding protein